LGNLLNIGKTRKTCRFESGIESSVDTSVESGFFCLIVLAKKHAKNLNEKIEKGKLGCKIVILKEQLGKSAEHGEKKTENMQI
jgi:hypothetical protein